MNDFADGVGDFSSDTDSRGSSSNIRSQPLIDVGDNDDREPHSYGHRSMPAHTIIDGNNERDPYDLTLLMRENRRLMLENTELRRQYHDGGVDARWPTLHRIQCPHANGFRTYSDMPVVVKQDGHEHVDSYRRISDERAWETAQRNLPFVVYKTYSCRPTLSEDAVQDPDVTGEEVHILSPALLHTLERLFQSHPGLSIYGAEILGRTKELYAPYVFVFHFQDHIRSFLSSAGMDKSALQLLLDYLEEQSSQERTESMELFRQGLTNAKFVPYLFPPGQLVVTTGNGEPLVLNQASLLQERSSQSRARVWTCYATSIVFDGDFRMLEQEIRINLDSDKIIPIVDLSIYPADRMEQPLRDMILQRGIRFYACRTQQYVTCTSSSRNEKDHFVGTTRKYRHDTETDISQGESRYMVDVRAYYMLHGDEKRPDGPIIEPRPDDETFLLQLPPVIQGFRMVDKRWGTWTILSRSQHH